METPHASKTEAPKEGPEVIKNQAKQTAEISKEIDEMLKEQAKQIDEMIDDQMKPTAEVDTATTPREESKILEEKLAERK